MENFRIYSCNICTGSVLRFYDIALMVSHMLLQHGQIVVGTDGISFAYQRMLEVDLATLRGNIALLQAQGVPNMEVNLGVFLLGRL